MAQSRSTKIISMIKWIRTSRLSMKKSLSRVSVECLVFGVEGSSGIGFGVQGLGFEEDGVYDL